MIEFFNNLSTGTAIVGTIVIVLVLGLIRRWLRYKSGQRAASKAYENIRPGDEVVLMSGIYGKVERVADAKAWVRIAENTVITVRLYSIVGNQNEFEKADRERLDR